MNALKTVRDFIKALDGMAADDRQAAIEIIARMGCQQGSVGEVPRAVQPQEGCYRLPTFNLGGWHICGYGVEMPTRDTLQLWETAGLGMLPRRIWEAYVEQHPEYAGLDVHLDDNLPDGGGRSRVFVAAVRTGLAAAELTWRRELNYAHMPHAHMAHHQLALIERCLGIKLTHHLVIWDGSWVGRLDTEQLVQDTRVFLENGGSVLYLPHGPVLSFHPVEDQAGPSDYFKRVR